MKEYSYLVRADYPLGRRYLEFEPCEDQENFESVYNEIRQATRLPYSKLKIVARKIIWQSRCVNP